MNHNRICRATEEPQGRKAIGAAGTGRGKQVKEGKATMKSEVLKEFVAMIETNAQRRPSALEFEMAYQVRIAMDRIRFAIKATETPTEHAQLRDAGLQLLDALDRLQAAELHFQNRWRSRYEAKPMTDRYQPTWVFGISK
jgi:hypothetical protein